MSRSEREFRTFFHTYHRLPIEILRGSGMYLFTADGTRYLDLVGGIGVNALGYGHPSLLRAIEEQCRRYIHVSNYFLQEPQLALAERLLDISGLARIFLANSGTECTEGAMKLARRWGLTQGKTEIVAFTGAFHGRTMGALSLMDRGKYRQGYEPLLGQCRISEFNNVSALRATVSRTTSAVVVEFIQGEGGVRPVSPEFAAALEELRRQYGFLLIADEVQSGVGRTGRFFSYEHFGAHPDIVTIAKPIGGGLPLGAILGNERVADVFQPGVHGTTFGGNPVACAAGMVVLREILDGGLMRNAASAGSSLMRKLRQLQERFPSLVREVRGYGLMVGMELTRSGEPVIDALRNRHILLNCTAGNVLRFLPPLIINDEHIDEAMTALHEVMTQMEGSTAPE